MKKFFFISSCILSMALSMCSCQESESGYKSYLMNLDHKEEFRSDMDSLTAFIERQYTRSLSVSSPRKGIPRNSYKDGCIRNVPLHDWCSGYYGGTLWYIYELTGDAKWMKAAQKYTEVLEPIKNYVNTHDVGIIISASYGNGYRLTGNAAYLDVMKATAASLCKRFNPEIGAILSWGDLKSVPKMKYHNMIIDNMINLELLMTCGEPEAEKIAVSHANKTMQTHFRPDGSCYHVQEINKETGEIRKDQNQTQGLNYESEWARGQGWAMYGYSNMYEWTGDEKYLETAVKCADHFIGELPEDLVPWWDFKDPRIPETYRDASAAGVAACALWRLSSQLKDQKKSLLYYNIAMGLLNELTENYMATEDFYRCLILHSVGHHPNKTEIDTNINYADYYYMEALLKLTGNYKE